VLLASVLLTTVGLIAYRSGSRSLEQAAISEVVSSGIEKEGAVNSWLDERLTDVQQNAIRTDLVEKAADLVGTAPETAESRSARAVVMPELEPLVSGPIPAFVEAYVLDPVHGRVMASTRVAEEGKFKAGHLYFENGKNGLYLDGPYKSRDAGGPSMTAAMPLRSPDGRVVAVLAARLNLAVMNAIVQQRSGLHQTDDAFLVNSDGLAVTQPRFIGEAVVLRRPIPSEAVRLCAAHNNGVSRAADYRGVPCITVYRWNSERQLGLIVKIDEAEALAPVRAFGRAVAFISGLALLATGVLALLLARTITKPLRALRDGVMHFAEGHSPAPLAESSTDEVGQLAAEFNRMTACVAERAVQISKSHQALQESKTRLQDFIDHSPAVLYVLKLEATSVVPTLVSENISRLLGFTVAESSSHEWWVAQLHPEDRKSALAGMAESIAHDTSCVEYRLRHKDGSYRDVEDSRRLVRDTAGNPMELVGVLADITDRKRSEAAVAKARDAALESARLKSVFLANMSHEIRTPMNGVIGMLNLLADTALKPEQHDFLETARSSAESLLTVLNDILDFSKIEAGKLVFEDIDFDLREVVEGTVDLFARKAQEKGLELICDVEDGTPTALRGDPTRLRQVLLNIVGNAIKFTGQGEVVLTVRGQREAADAVRVECDVRDTGIGISSKAQAHLFEAFTQCDGSTTRKYGGTGLGLAIARRLVEFMHGKISIKSEEGRGSIFSFSAMLHSGKVMEAPPRAKLAGQRLLIVDDNPTNRAVLHHQLKAWGMRNASASTGAEALQALRFAAACHDPFHLALLDLQMPEMDGIELARAIKADPALDGTRVVILTSLGVHLKTDVRQAAGIDQCLFKPVRQARLFDCITRTLAEVSPGNAAISAPAAIAAPAMPALRILLAEDNRVNQKVALAQLRHLGQTADVAANGLEALEAHARAAYSVILMDCQMPEMEGYEATRRIRQLEFQSGHGAHPAYIIAMTANALDGDAEKCLAAGMDEYLSKPVLEASLEAALRRAAETVGGRQVMRHVEK